MKKTTIDIPIIMSGSIIKAKLAPNMVHSPHDWLFS
jgi:hypothetical protein